MYQTVALVYYLILLELDYPPLFMYPCLCWIIFIPDRNGLTWLRVSKSSVDIVFPLTL